MSRFPFLDQLRGHAVIWMIIFHFTYDLKALGFIQLDMSSCFWYGFPRFIAFTIFLCVGFSSYFVHRKYIRWNFLKRRSLVLGLSARLISLSTYFLFTDQWIFL